MSDPIETTASDNSEAPKERIAKRMARAGLCSRREAERWIEQGRVRVNGSKISSAALNVSDEDDIIVDNVPLQAKSKTRLWLYHKPTGLVTTHKDPHERNTVFDMLPKSLPRVISVGRLDVNSEGLLLLTNDGELSRFLELPSTGWIRHYRVRAHGRLTDDAITVLKEGVVIDKVHYGSITVTPEDKGGANRWYKVALCEGKNRELRKVFEYFDCKVNRLIRTAYGPFQLGTIARGDVKEVQKRALKSFLPQFS